MGLAETLLRQIFASELDYQEIDNRAAVLRALPKRTVDEQRVLDDYERKLQHDRDVIANWKTLITKEGVDITKEGDAIRQQVLDEQIASILDFKAEHIKELFDVKEVGEPTAEMTAIDYAVQKQAAIDARTMAMNKLDDAQRYIDLVNTLKAGGSIWPQK